MFMPDFKPGWKLRLRGLLSRMPFVGKYFSLYKIPKMINIPVIKAEWPDIRNALASNSLKEEL
jgi:hypothetical protein